MITELKPSAATWEPKKEAIRGRSPAILPMSPGRGSGASRQIFRPSLAQCGASLNRCRSHHPPCGWAVFAASDHRERGPERFRGRSAFSSSVPTRRRPGCTPITMPITGWLKNSPIRDHPNSAGVVFSCVPGPTRRRGACRRPAPFQFALRFYGASTEPQRPAPALSTMWERIQQMETREPARPGGGAARRPSPPLTASHETIAKSCAGFEARISIR